MASQTFAVALCSCFVLALFLPEVQSALLLLQGGGQAVNMCLFLFLLLSACAHPDGGICRILQGPAGFGTMIQVVQLGAATGSTGRALRIARAHRMLRGSSDFNSEPADTLQQGLANSRSGHSIQILVFADMSIGRTAVHGIRRRTHHWAARPQQLHSKSADNSHR